MNLKQKLVDLLEHAYGQEQVFVQGLSDKERSCAGTLERWSAKDTIAHIAAWKERAAQVLAALRSGEPGPDFDGLDQVNARVFQEHQNLMWSNVLTRSAQAYVFLREQTEATPDNVLTAQEPSDWHNEPVWWFVVGTGYTHSLGHLAQFYIGRGNTARATEMHERAAGRLLQLDESADWRGLVHYRLASHYAATGQLDEAIDALHVAFRFNPALVERSNQDPCWTSIRENPAYRLLHIE